VTTAVGLLLIAYASCASIAPLGARAAGTNNDWTGGHGRDADRHQAWDHRKAQADTLQSTNPCGSMIGTVRAIRGNVKTRAAGRCACGGPPPGCSKQKADSERSRATVALPSSPSRSKRTSSNAASTSTPNWHQPSICNHQRRTARKRISTTDGTAFSRARRAVCQLAAGQLRQRRSQWSAVVLAHASVLGDVQIFSQLGVVLSFPGEHQPRRQRGSLVLRTKTKRLGDGGETSARLRELGSIVPDDARRQALSARAGDRLLDRAIVHRRRSRDRPYVA
jgi:hypothetical protein